ncbi:thymidylate kinase [gamma proteobacterium HIMB55]|nr:thymidylate kinase [gamma proteobacterium HIMB55]
MKICFLGLDGSGKSTQSKILVDLLADKDIDVVYRHQFRYESETVMSAKNSLRPFIKRAQYLLCIPGSILIDSVILRVIRDNFFWRIIRPLVAHPIGLLVLFSGLIKARGKSRMYGSHHVFVMDRCFLDELARVEWKLSIRVPFKSLWFRLAPAPDYAFYFDIPGVESWARMDPVDTGKEAMVEKEKTYKRLIPEYSPYSPINVLDIVGADISTVTRQVIATLAKKDKLFESL